MAKVLALGFVGLFYVNQSYAQEDFVSHSGDNLDLRVERSLLQNDFIIFCILSRPVFAVGVLINMRGFALYIH